MYLREKEMAKSLSSTILLVRINQRVNSWKKVGNLCLNLIHALIVLNKQLRHERMIRPKFNAIIINSF